MAAGTSTPVLTMFDVVRAEALEDSSGKIRVIERAAHSNRTYTYQLQDRALWHPRFEPPIFTLATRGAGSLLTSFVASSFSTEVTVDGDEGSLYCFTTMLAGHITLEQKGRSTTATQQTGLTWRPGPGGRLLISDDNARTNVFLKAADIESTLEHMLDERLRRPLIFEPSLDWGTGLTASLKSQLDFVTQEFQRRDGVANNPIALASVTDLLVSLILRGTTHNYSDRLANAAGNPIPAYVRRAEDFMRAHGAEPIRMSHIAAAAGCSLRTLTAVFRHFRGSTPLAALHAVRLDLAHADLARGIRDASVATVARRYGFTNTARFRTAFHRRFGETPIEIARYASIRTAPASADPAKDE